MMLKFLLNWYLKILFSYTDLWPACWLVKRILTANSNETGVSLVWLQPVVSEKETEDGLRSVTFDRTPIMSSYLLAFIVGEYDYVEDRDSNGVLIRVYTPVGKKELGNFGLHVS